MKEQILHLDPHDDYISARDKMGWVQTQRVVLVWPPREARVLNRRLDLVLLHRHAHRLGAQLALVTKDSTVREHAMELGLPVFESVVDTRRMRWRSRVPRVRPERRQPRPDTASIRETLFKEKQPLLPPRVELALRIAFLSIGALALLTLGYALVPSATITLTPAPQPIAVTLEIIADPAASGQRLAAGRQQSAIILARRVRVEVQKTDLTATTGSVDVPKDKATGTIIFTNIVGTAALIPQGTSVRTGGTGVRFVTQQAVNIEGRIGAVAEVEVQAVEAGPAGNVPATLINTIDGPLGTQLAVTNPISTTGGTVEQRAAVAQADRDRLRAQLLRQLQQSAADALAAQLQPGEFLASETVTITQVLAESFEHAVGEPIDAITLTMRIAATGLAVDEREAQAAAQAALEAQVPAAATLDPASLRFTRDPALAVDEAGRVHFNLTAEGSLIPHLDREVVRQLARRQSIPNAAQSLQRNLPLAAPPQITLAPDWLARWYPYLPWMPVRIEVVIE